MVTMPVILFFIFQSITTNPATAQEIISTFNSSSSTSKWNNTKTTSVSPLNDTTPPLVNITYPSYPPTLTTGNIIIEGTASDSGSGIKNVSAVAHTFPFNGNFTVPLASQPIPTSHNNWSHWSVPLIINKTNSYRVVITAIDKSGNPNYSETTINAPINKTTYNNIYGIGLHAKKTIPKFAIVRPTFTEAAYQENGFYRFYYKYGFPSIGRNITTDLDMLTVKTPGSVAEFPKNDIKHLSNITSLIPVNGTELHDISQGIFPYQQKFWLPFIDHVKKVADDVIVTVMRDEDVHDGHIFYPNNKTNMYDVLLLSHNEYVTQQEYDNLRQFVKNGGTIVFIDANVLYGEVSYDRNNHTITLVKGHDWKFDGKAASRSVSERWYNETKEWVGSNFLINNINEKISFANNPFNYTHFEEQFVNNPKDNILIDYGIKFPKDFAELYLKKEKLPAELMREDIPIENISVATYSLNYGKGKVIMSGITGRLLANNPDFMRFFDNVILPHSLCPKFESCLYLPTSNYLYGCTDYEYRGFHCDPIANVFESYKIPANYTKITSVTREPPFVESKYGMGLRMTPHSHESLRANIINSYNANQFSFYLSIVPGKGVINSNIPLISYKNGVYVDSFHNAGWDIELVPSKYASTKTVRFLVYNTSGFPTSSKNIDIHAGKSSDITGTFDGKTVRMYINGTLMSETPFRGNYSGKIDPKIFLKVGGEPYCFCYDLNDNSTFDEIRYYNYSLNDQEIKQINNHSHDVLGNGLVGYWKFNGDLKDNSVFKNDMFYNTLIGSMAFAPDGRLFYTEKNSGIIRILANNTVLGKPFAEIPNIHVNWEQGLLGLAIDSKFRENHFIYVYYDYKDNGTGKIYAKILRFTDVDNEGKEQTVILDKIPASTIGLHTGGALAFNEEDDKLYATVGDATDDRRAQNLSSLNGKTLRINRDGSVPDDNPFPNSPVYTYGHRNMYGIAFDELGHGIVTEAGADLYDEINSQIKGGNYGWPTMQPANIAPDPFANDSSIKPIRSYFFTKTPTQAIYYNGDRYPMLKGKFIVGSFDGDLFAYNISRDGMKLLSEILIQSSSYPSDNVVATAVSPDGYIYFGAYDIFRLDKLNVTTKEIEMYPIHLNATKSKVVTVNYSEKRKEVTVGLTDRHGLSTLSVKIPKSLIDDAPGRYECNIKNNVSATKLNESVIPYNLKVHGRPNSTIMIAQFQSETPENLTMNPTSVGCIKED